MTSGETVALFPASFDPITNDHLDVARRALRIFGRLVMGVAVNVTKRETFTVEERIEMVRAEFADDPRVEVTSFEGLTVDYARQIGAAVVIRGVRAMSDFEYEFEMALMNRRLAPDVDVVCLMTELQYQFVRASLIKEVARLGGDINGLAPPNVIAALKAKFGN